MIQKMNFNLPKNQKAAPQPQAQMTKKTALDNSNHNSSSKTTSEVLDYALRPRSLKEFFFGGTVKRGVFSALRIFLQAAQERGDPLDHVLFYGPPGLGKTTLAHILAHEMKVNVRATSGPAIERTGDLASILTNLQTGDILFIDEIHRLNKAVEETMYSAMEDFCLDIILGKGPSAQTIRLDLPKFTIIGATTRISLMSSPLRDRFGVTHRLDFFNQDELSKIISRSASLLNIQLDPSSCREIAKRARGTPRIANRLLKRIRDFSQVNHACRITPQIVKKALDILEVDEEGLDKNDQRYLKTLIHKFKGGPAGLSTLASALAEDQGTLEEVIEPFLLQKGFIKRTPKGRVATERAYQHLGIAIEKKTRLL